MGTTVGDVIFKIEKYKKLKEKISVSFDERESNHFESTEDSLDFIKSKLTYDDILQLEYLVDNQIEMLRKMRVIEDGDDD